MKSYTRHNYLFSIILEEIRINIVYNPCKVLIFLYKKKLYNVLFLAYSITGNESKVDEKALIIDLCPDASPDAIDIYVDNVGLSRLNTLITQWTFQHILIERAYSQKPFRDMVAGTKFKACEIKESALELDVSLRQ